MRICLSHTPRRWSRDLGEYLHFKACLTCKPSSKPVLVGSVDLLLGFSARKAERRIIVALRLWVTTPALQAS